MVYGVAKRLGADGCGQSAIYRKGFSVVSINGGVSIFGSFFFFFSFARYKPGRGMKYDRRCEKGSFYGL